MTDDIERRIEEALMRRGSDVRPEPGAWNAIEQKARRSQRTRAFLAGVAAAALVAGAVVIVPKLVGDDEPRTPNPIASSPGATGTPTTQPTQRAIPAGWSALRHEADGYSFALPDGWKAGVFEGHTSYRPPGLGSPEEGAETFFVEIWRETTQIPFSGTKSSATVAGRKATRYESQQDEAHTVTYVVDDWPCWAGPGVDVDCDPPKLIVQVYASTAALWEKHGADGEETVRFLHAAAEAVPAGGYRTVHGRVAAGVDYDDKTYATIRFMESRVFGDVDTAKEYLSQNALTQYENHEGGLDLYDPDSTRGLSTYTIEKREGVDANSVEMTVLLQEHSRGDGKPPSRARETLGVGPGTNAAGSQRGAVIRFATRTAA